MRDFQGVIGGFLRDFVAIAGFIIFFDYEIAEKSLGYLCTERDFWGVYRGMLGDSRTQKPRAGVAVVALLGAKDQNSILEDLVLSSAIAI